MSKLYVDEIHPKTSGNHVTRPELPAFFARSSSHTYISAGQKVVYDNVTGTGCFNQGNHYSTDTSQFTAPVDGVYSFAAQFYSNNQAAANMYIEVNNVAVASSQVNGTDDASAYEGIEMAVTLKLEAGDTVHIEASSGGYHQNSAYSYF